MKIYEVGGAVRDALLKTKAKDRDWVVVGSSPEEMIEKGFKPIGKDFPVFLHPSSKEEYALARTERKTGHGYHGFNFYYGKEVTLEEDLSRRDFTINAIAKDDSGRLIDPFGGIADIKNKIFRHVSDAFSEDPLRAIRLARFRTYDHLKDFVISEETSNLINTIINLGEISTLSKNRIWAETERALSSNNPSIYFETLVEYGMHSYHFKDLKNTNCSSVSDPCVRWAELQINNSFLLGNDLPKPNSFINASQTLKVLSEIPVNPDEECLLVVLKKIRLVRDEALISHLVCLPHLKETKKLILSLIERMKNADFSILSKVSNEHIEEEKIKLLKKVIKNLNE